MKTPPPELQPHEEADGILEEDNPLPDWWVGLFLVCIAWSAVYAVRYHVLESADQGAWYDAEVADAATRWPELSKPKGFDDSPETLAAGDAAFQKNCVACHNAALTGGIGPNLTDDRWIHGGGFDAVRATIDKGIGAKGMPAWGPQLGPQGVAAVASYVLSKNQGEAGRALGTAMGAYAEGGASVGVAGAEAPTSAPAAEASPPPAAAPVPAAVQGPPEVVAGATVYNDKCVACHGPELKGGVGPDLTDTTWIHGGDLASIKATITKGIPEKGMITWGGILSDAEIHNVASFVLSKGQ